MAAAKTPAKSNVAKSDDIVLRGRDRWNRLAINNLSFCSIDAPPWPSLSYGKGGVLISAWTVRE
jgi:hypothetical protein